MNQYYLGRCLVKLNRHAEDLFDLDREERQELFEKIMPDLRKAIDESFRPEMYNYASLGNEVRHLHLHLIPRYKEERNFEGHEFRDERFGSHYKPYPRDFDIPDRLFDRIRHEIRDGI